MRLIDADALMADIERTIENSGCVNHEGEIMDCIRYASEVDAVPVVRCRECKRFERHTEVDTECGGCYPPGKALSVRTVHENDYCSHGEKMEDEP
jgi:hypothetical protein